MIAAQGVRTVVRRNLHSYRANLLSRRVLSELSFEKAVRIHFLLKGYGPV